MEPTPDPKPTPEPTSRPADPQHDFTAEEKEAERQAVEALGHLRKTFEYWCVIGDMLNRYRGIAMRRTGINDPTSTSKLLRNEYGAILKASPFCDLEESLRVGIQQCGDPAIRAWHAALPENDRINLNHPEKVLKRWKQYQRNMARNVAGVPDKREAAKAAKKAKADEKARVEANNAQVNADAIARTEAAEAELAKLKANGTTEADPTTGADAATDTATDGTMPEGPKLDKHAEGLGKDF